MNNIFTISNISPGNKSLEFIEKRIADDQYRGSRSSQHNRYTLDKIYKILSLFNSYSPNGELMRIRSTDISKRPANIPEEYLYSEFCNAAKETVGIGTQDAMRKNLFVDLHRMGLIKRFNINKVETDPFSSSGVLYVSLSEQGLKLITADNILNRYFIFSKAVDNLIGGYIEILLNILRDSDNDLEKISIYEFMFFISAINTKTTFDINYTECVDYIKSFRNLTPYQRIAVTEKMKQVLKPENYSGNKTSKRDFHNWKNKAEQVFKLLNQTVYFEVRGEVVVLKTGVDSYEGTKEPTRLDRSLSEKYNYFVNHKVEKALGFELHHIVPLAWSESIHQFKILDKWENMVYIDAFSHAKITQNRNRNVVARSNDDDLILSDFNQNEVHLENIKNILYDLHKQSAVLEYNKQLLETIK